MRGKTIASGLTLLASGSLASASGGGAEGGGLGEQLIMPHYGTVIWTALTFLMMLIILRRFAWGPLLGALEDRETTIKGNLDRAERERAEATAVLEQHKNLVQEARRERAEALAQGRRDAESLKAEILEEAKQQREQILKQTEAQVETSMRQARGELRGVATDLAIQAAERLLSRNLDDAGQRKLVEEYLSQLERSSGDRPLPS